MKKLKSFILFAFITKASFAQILYPDILQVAVSSSVEYSGSGHGTNASINILTLNDYKSFEFGLIVSGNTAKVRGASLKYKSFVGKYNYYYENTLIKPYIIYNCMYQTEYVFQPLTFETSTETIVAEDEIGGYVSTIEHYAGMGVMFMFLNNFYFDSNIGIGAYFGSLDKNNAPNKLGFHGTNNGITADLKVGIGYILR